MTGRWWALLVGLVVSGAADVATTVTGLRAGFGEASPLASTLWASSGVLGLVLAKGVPVCWSAVAGLMVPRVGLLLGWGLVAATVIGAGRNLLLVNEAGWLLW